MLLEKIDRYSKRDKLALGIILTLGSIGLIVTLIWHTTHSFSVKAKNGTNLNGTTQMGNVRDIDEIDRRFFISIIKLVLNKRLRSFNFCSGQCGRFIQPMMKQG